MEVKRMCLAKQLGKLSDYSLLPLRLALGSVFIVHGAQKIFTFGVSKVAGMFPQFGAAAIVVAWLVSLGELLGGIAILTGAGTRIGAISVAIIMAGAIGLVHFKNGFSGQGGYEFQLSLLLMAVTLAITGAGKVLNLEKKILKKEL